MAADTVYWSPAPWASEKIFFVKANRMGTAYRSKFKLVPLFFKR